jgi:hypothetical protein
MSSAEAGAERHDERLHARQRDPADNNAEQKRCANREGCAGRGVGRQQMSRSGRLARHREVNPPST